ncbi:LysM domain-containing protein [Azohydromonas caseinilytica]|uniref:LysM domain-containing protein n=1 Tax=Azohydromonas caseinilytica TaxID=2728836 RepID=A0A848FBY7_9BURK|nr:LysM domain-containing protein [Azohydromonas caseinilytica]NML16828.1 LysM domain-containing protein [Azohydromonas caseinilytica]
MFTRSSRYAGLPTAAVPDPHGPGEVAVVRLRALPDTAGEPLQVQAHDRLDALAEARLGEATRYWRIADANTEIEAAALTRRAGRVIRMPGD